MEEIGVSHAGASSALHNERSDADTAIGKILLVNIVVDETNVSRDIASCVLSEVSGCVEAAVISTVSNEAVDAIMEVTGASQEEALYAFHNAQQNTAEAIMHITSRK